MNMRQERRKKEKGRKEQKKEGRKKGRRERHMYRAGTSKGKTKTPLLGVIHNSEDT